MTKSAEDGTCSGGELLGYAVAKLYSDPRHPLEPIREVRI